MESEWAEATFSELCTIVRGGSPRPINDFLQKTGIPWVKIADATGSGTRFIEKTNDFIKEEGKKNSREVYPGDLILSNSATPGLPMFMAIYACVHDGWLLLRDFKGFNKLFCYYLLIHERANLVQQGNGSVFTNLKTEILKNHTIKLPPLTEQNTIAHILGSLDDKIELNRKMNETLEAMAQAIFKSWFVDFDPVIDNALAAGNSIPEELQDRAAIREALGNERKPLPEDIRKLFQSEFELTEEMGWVPKGWEVGPLSNLADLNPEAWNAKTVPRKLNYVDLANTKNGRINLIAPFDFANAPSRARRVLRTDDSIVGTVRPGNRSFAYIHEDGLTGSTGFAVMRPIQKYFRSFIYLCLTRNETIDYFANLADGGAYPAIRPEVVSRFQYLQPIRELFIHFDEIVSPWIYGIGKRESANISLSLMRDTLLPKLISGELRIPDAEKLVEEVL